jgi:radical SAM superfamily enzyme YgiQ (UPF0313 family)
MLLILNPPNPPGLVSNKDTMGGFGQLYPIGAKHSFPPLDIAYTASLLRSKAIPANIVECLGSSLELSGLILLLEDQAPEFVAIRTSTPTFEWDMRVARVIKTLLNSKTIFFGPHVALSPEETIKQPFVDAIVLGEPERVILDICEAGGFSGCKGVWHKEGDEVLKNPQSRFVIDLDQLPFPSWDLLPYRAYSGGRLMRNLTPFVTALTSRGCPHGCGYCPYPVAQGRKLRVRSAENVVDELDWLINALGIKAVLFRDPEFALSRNRVFAICEGILQKGLQLAWRCETRMENLDEEMITIMARAGCIGMNLGVETNNAEVLRRMNRKPLSQEHAIGLVKACEKKGIETFCFFILGLPGETKESTLNNIEFALRLNSSHVQFTAATPYPGTELRKWAEERGFIEKQSMADITGYEVVMRNEHMTTEEIRKLVRLAHEALEARPRVAARRVLGNVQQILAEVKRLFSFKREWRRQSDKV